MIACVCRIVAVLAMVSVPIATVAQVIPPSEQPGRERERFVLPPAPRAQPGAPVISLPSTVAPPGAEKVRLRVRAVQIVGSSVYSAEELAPLYRDLVGREVSLQAIYDLARRITAKYGSDGYVLSRAIVPVQKLSPKGAVIRIQVIEGWINRVEWPKSLARYRDFFSVYTAKIIADRPVNIRTIERYLLLASDLPGLKFNTTLRPSEKDVGASTLVVAVTEKPFDVYGRVDNRGTKARGPFQFLASATLNNLLGQHEALTVSYAGATQLRELQYASGTYKQVLNSEGLTGFVNAGYSWGRPGTPQLEILDFRTRSTFAEAGLSYPVIRARERNLTLTGLAFMSDNYSDVLSAPFNVDRLRGIRLKADADAADSLQGVNQFYVIYSQGIDGLGSTENGNPLASRAAGRVDFSKLEGYGSRTQPLYASFSAFAAVYGLYGFTSLLSPEQCGYGGRLFGRAFDPSQLLGDRCIQLLGELRYDLPTAGSQLSQFQLYGFTDWGRLWTIAPAAGTPASVEAASVGAGFRVWWQSYVNVDLSVAKGVEGPRDDWRFFFIVVARN